MRCKLVLVSGLYAVVLIQVVSGYFSCNFENSVDTYCGFYNDRNNGFNWKLDTAFIQNSFTRPVADHSYSNRSGHYFFIESSFPSSPGPTGRISRFLSPTIFVPQSTGNPNASFCLTFYYHMYGPPNQNLHVFVKEHGEAIPQFSHWNVSGNLGDTWRENRMDITINEGFQVIFQGTKGSTYHGDISLDDISVTEGQCIQDNNSNVTASTTTPATFTVAQDSALNEFNCNFEYNDICGFIKDTRNAFDWEWRGDSPRPTKGPLGDHTLGSSSGFYLFVTTDPGNPQRQQEQSSRIVSPLFSRNSAHRCLQFFFYMRGSNLGQLNGYILKETYTPPLVPNWSFSMSSADMWHVAFMDVPRQQSNYRVMFEVLRSKDFDGTVAIDDLILTNGLCPVVNVSCDFESGLGDLIQDSSDDRNWNLALHGTPSHGTGPKYDHTLGTQNGKFLFIETSYGRSGHVARLLSPVLIATTVYPRCLTFWYHMYGEDIDTLNVYIVNGTDSNSHDILWTMSGNRGNKWRAAEVHLESTVDFQVVFEAKAGTGYRGDISIDDINIEADVCPGEHHFHNYSSITCDFEEAELCYYEQEETEDDIDWAWINSDSASRHIPTGPSTDHTVQNELGFYLFVSFETSYKRFSHESRKAWLKSPYATPQKSPSCVEFWYHMYGRNAEILKVFIQLQGEEIPTTHAWKKSGDQGNFWHRATFDIDVINTPFRLVFKATTGKTYQNDIAIDDVTFYNSTSCPPFVTEPPPPVTPPPTTNNASCDFETDDICGYMQVINDNLDWSRRNRWRYSGSGARQDHTFGSSSGYFMNFDCSYSLRFDFRAQLATPYSAPHAKPRCMHFYYYMNGRGVDVLNLYLVAYGYTLTNDPQMSLFGSKGNEWKHGTFDLPPSSKPYKVIFEAVRGEKGYQCDISIDDIIFLDGSCSVVSTTPEPSYYDGSCDFESSDDPLCGYYQEDKKYVDDFDWTLNSGNTSSIETGPSNDHTYRTGEGHYIYIESSLPNRPAKRAWLRSPFIQGSTEEMCIQFYYHMKGDGIGHLKIIKQAVVGNTENQQLKMIQGHQGDEWNLASIALQPFNGEFQLIFEATVGMIPYGDIAIDDIIMIRHRCDGHLKEAS